MVAHGDFVAAVFGHPGEEWAPPIVAGLGVLIAALIALNTFNNVVLGEGLLNKYSNALAFAAAGKGSSLLAATDRIVSVPPRRSNLTNEHKLE